MLKKISRPLKEEDLSLKELVDLREWRKIQDNFSTITNLGIRLLGAKGNPVTHPSGQPRLCSELLKKSPLKDALCGGCLPTFLGGKAVVDRHLSTVCKAGLHNFIVPLKYYNNVLGFIQLGPLVLVMRKPKEEYRKIAEELNVDLEEFWSALLEIKVMSFQSTQSVMELIRDVGEYTIKLAHDGLMKKREVVMTEETPKLKRLLNALLDVAFQVTGADIGSIMLMDKYRKHLTIRTSKGISEEIVRNAKVKLGEGISGMAVEEGRPYLIDDGLEDNRIKQYLRRPSISSSMVIPIKVEDEVLGVINLGASRPSSVRFDINNMHLVDKLIDLATVVFHD
jgi:ligand-binding sensor protein